VCLPCRFPFWLAFFSPRRQTDFWRELCLSVIVVYRVSSTCAGPFFLIYVVIAESEYPCSTECFSCILVSLRLPRFTAPSSGSSSPNQVPTLPPPFCPPVDGFLECFFQPLYAKIVCAHGGVRLIGTDIVLLCQKVGCCWTLFFFPRPSRSTCFW